MNPVAEVANKSILITGAASGIGAETASILAERGAKVILSDVNLDAGQKLSNKLMEQGHFAKFQICDVSDAASVAALFAFAQAQMGRIDVVLNNAGVYHTPCLMHEISEEDFDRNININLKGVWYCMREAVRYMSSTGGGQVINVSSVAGLRSAPTAAAYSAVKHGVIGLTRTAALEYTKINMRFNAICPSFIDTPLVQGVLSQIDEKRRHAVINASPMRRLGKVEEVANLIAWLASDESSFINGHEFTIDGGMLA